LSRFAQCSPTNAATGYGMRTSRARPDFGSGVVSQTRAGSPNENTQFSTSTEEYITDKVEEEFTNLCERCAARTNQENTSGWCTEEGIALQEGRTLNERSSRKTEKKQRERVARGMGRTELTKRKSTSCRRKGARASVLRERSIARVLWGVHEGWSRPTRASLENVLAYNSKQERWSGQAHSSIVGIWAEGAEDGREDEASGRSFCVPVESLEVLRTGYKEALVQRSRKRLFHCMENGAARVVGAIPAKDGDGDDLLE